MEPRITASNMASLCCPELGWQEFHSVLKEPLTSVIGIYDPSTAQQETNIVIVGRSDVTDVTHATPEKTAASETATIDDSSAKLTVDAVQKLSEDCSGARPSSFDPVVVAFHQQQCWSARYGNVPSLSLSELREAFLYFAVEPPPQSDRSSELQPRLSPLDVGRCLRAVGQNPTVADVQRMLSVIEQRIAARLPPSDSQLRPQSTSVQQLTAAGRMSMTSQKQSISQTKATNQKSPGKKSPRSVTNKAATTKKLPSTKQLALSKSGDGKRQRVQPEMPTKDVEVEAILQPSGEEGITSVRRTWDQATVSMDDFLFAVNDVYAGKFQDFEHQVDDLVSAFGVFDDEEEGAIDATRLMDALRSLGEPLEQSDLDSLIVLVDAASDSDGKLNIGQMVVTLCN